MSSVTWTRYKKGNFGCLDSSHITLFLYTEPRPTPARTDALLLFSSPAMRSLVHRSLGHFLGFRAPASHFFFPPGAISVMEDKEWQQRAKRRLEDESDQDIPSPSDDDGRQKRSRQESSSLSDAGLDSPGDFSDDPLLSASSSGTSTHDTTPSTFHYPSFHAWTQGL